MTCSIWAYQRKLETFETLTTTQNDTVIGGFCCSCSGSAKTALNTLFNDVTLWQHMASIEQLIMLNMRHHRKGSGWPVGLGAGEGDRVHASTHVCTSGKRDGPELMCSHGQGPMPIPVTYVSCNVFPGELMTVECMGTLTLGNAAASIVLWLFCCHDCSPVFGQAEMTQQSNAWVQRALWAETGAPPPCWAGSWDHLSQRHPGFRASHCIMSPWGHVAPPEDI